MAAHQENPEKGPAKGRLRRPTAGAGVAAGPLSVGAGDAASVMAKGDVGAPVARRASPDPDGTRRFVVSIPVELKLSVKVAGSVHRFEASIVARIRLAARTARPLGVLIDIAPPEVFDMEVDVRSSGIVAKVLGRLGNVDKKIREEIVRFITDRLATEVARRATVIDITPHIDKVWHPGGLDVSVRRLLFRRSCA